MSPPHEITTPEAAERYGLDPRYFRQLLLQGRIKGRKVGKVWWKSSGRVPGFRAVEDGNRLIRRTHIASSLGDREGQPQSTVESPTN